MHDDPKLYRMIGCCLIVVCIVCLLTLKRIPLIVAIPTLAFFFWRWWEQRKRVGDWGSPWVYPLYLWIKNKLRRGVKHRPGTALVPMEAKLPVERKGD